MPEPVTTRNGVRRRLKNLTRTVGDKISVEIHENGNGAKRTHPNGKRDSYLRNTRQTRLQTNGAHEKRLPVHKNYAKNNTGCALELRDALTIIEENDVVPMRLCVVGRKTLLTRVLWSALDDTWVCDMTPRRRREMVTPLAVFLLRCSSCPCKSVPASTSWRTQHLRVALLTKIRPPWETDFHSGALSKPTRQRSTPPRTAHSLLARVAP